MKQYSSLPYVRIERRGNLHVLRAGMWPSASSARAALAGTAVHDRVFSTALRLSSPGVRLWTHYDIMDNVLCNVRGRKRVRLWRPEEVQHLYVVRRLHQAGRAGGL